MNNRPKKTGNQKKKVKKETPDRRLELRILRLKAARANQLRQPGLVMLFSGCCGSINCLLYILIYTEYNIGYLNILRKLGGSTWALA